MGTRIFKLALFKPTLDAMMLTQEQVQQYFQKNDQIKKDLGVRELAYGSIFSDEAFTGFTTELFPDWKAVAEYTRCLNEMNWFQYIQSEVFLGVDSEENQNQLQPVEQGLVKDGIALIWLVNQLPAFYGATDAEKAEAMKVFELQQSLGMRQLLSVNARPMNECWDGWGVEAYPSMEALLEKSAMQAKVNWWKFLSGRTYLGRLEGGELVR